MYALAPASAGTGGRGAYIKDGRAIYSSTIAALAFAMLWSSAAAADDSNPAFLQAGIFFMTGQEPPKDVQFHDDLAVVYDENTWHEQNWGLPSPKRGHRLVHNYYVSNNKPGTIIGVLAEAPYGSERLDFEKLPSPRAMETETAMRLSTVVLKVRMILPNDTWCRTQTKNEDGMPEDIPNTTVCMTDFSMMGVATVMRRRLRALDYIRANFCPGQPEPPPKPQKPY